jgi:uncharacterized protein
MSKEYEYRFNASQLTVEKRDNEPAKLCGYAIVYDSLSEDMGYREKIKPNAVTNLDDKSIMAYGFHNREKPLGSVKNGTLRLEDTPTGVYVEILPPDNSYGKDIVESVRRGDLDSMSFRFKCLSDSWAIENGENIRTLNSIEIGEVSIVSEPAYQDTSIALRSFDKFIMGQDKKETDNRARMLKLVEVELDL